MAAGRWQFVNSYSLKQLQGQFDWDSDTLKMFLVTSASNISTTSTTMAGVTNELASGNGYTTGGNTVTMSLATVNTRDAEVRFSTSWTFTATKTFRYAVLGESGGDVIMYGLLADSPPADTSPTVNKLFTVNSSIGLPAFVLST